uniref:USP domain-containing protein n=1 Tax=Ficedula albicollis TaxID=59894 RepID=A0A803VWX5_FICAL
AFGSSHLNMVLSNIVSSLFKRRLPADIAEGMALPPRIVSPYEKICMDWQQRQRPGAGLFNLGNTCYVNVILQCLTYTPPLANYLLSSKHSQSCQQQGFCMMCTMEAHVRKVLCSSGEQLNSFLVIGEEFEYGRQENAYEFLRCTLSAMHRACLSGSSK